MIRKLMASSALAALLAAGGFSAAAAQGQGSATAPAGTEQPAAANPAQAPAGAGTSAEGAAERPAAGATQTQGFFADHPNLASRIIGQAVYSGQDPDSDRIGDVNDLVLDEDGKVTQAVIGVGGFLGIGEKDVAVPIDEVAVVERDGEMRLVYASTRDELESAERFDRRAYDPRARDAQAAPAGDARTAAPARPDAQEQARDASQAAADRPDAGAGGRQPAGDAAPGAQEAPATSFVNWENEGQLRASTIIGREVYGEGDESIGEVSDIVLQADGGTRAAIVDVGGFLGAGEKRIAVPFDQIRFEAEGDEPRLAVAMAREQLEQAPAYEAEREAADADAAGATPDAAGRPAAANQPAGADAPANAPASAPAADAPSADATAAGNARAMAGDGADAPAFAAQTVSADELLGTKITGIDDEDIGEVEDIVFTPQGDIQAVVVDVGGFLGMGEKPVAVAYDTLSVRKAEDGALRVTMNATEAQLKEAPAYQQAR
ncbi:PRC-barrel domain-containing protein [Faunimonas sp. B44]|uniref:PRC-barrel domain-containing protein n=1 Tax=Faunimonas sp. B44 TaxID=3461493 RepID=UPI00404423CF